MISCDKNDTEPIDTIENLEDKIIGEWKCVVRDNSVFYYVFKSDKSGKETIYINIPRNDNDMEYSAQRDFTFSVNRDIITIKYDEGGEDMMIKVTSFADDGDEFTSGGLSFIRIN
jgi:hypothetical protein